MTTRPEALRLAESLEADFRSDTYNFDDMIQAAAELRLLHAEVERLKSGYQGACYACEPVAEENLRLQNLNNDLENWVATLKERISYMKAYPQNFEREWVGLTDEEILELARDHYSPHQRPEISFARAIEAKLKEKNT
jgi:hypothetical protein